MALEPLDPRSQQPPVFVNVRRPASALNTFDDPQDIADTESPDVLNMVFDRGYATPRSGSFLAWSKPSGETNTLVNLINATDSARNEYAIGVYAPNFYLRDEVNNQWIQINGSYTPSTTYKSLPYGSIPWNAGVGSDVLYMGNGTEDTIKWPIALSYLSSAATSTSTTLALSSTAQFPASGTIVVMGNSGAFTLSYTAKSSTTLTLSGSVGQAVPSGAAVTMAIIDLSTHQPVSNFIGVTTASADTTITLSDASSFPASGVVSINNAGTLVAITYTSKSGNVLTITGTVGSIIVAGTTVALNVSTTTGVPKGKIFSKFQGRMFVGNSKGSETTMWYSVVNNPESYSIGSTPSSGGFYGFIQGTGEITGILDFGQYLGVLKGDSFHRFEFIIDSTNATKIDQVSPLVSDNAMGCPYFKQWVRKNTTLYYPSYTAGIFAIAPLVTGFQTTIQLNVLDLKIHNLYQSLNFSTGRSTAFDTKIFWACATSTAIDTVLVYDTLRQYWTRFNNWPVADWLVHKNLLYFGSYQDGNVYKCFDNSYTDNNNPYTSYAYTKRYDFGTASMPKTETRLFVQGYMKSSTTLYCDVLFNEQGMQQKLTYAIKGSQSYVIQPITTALAMAMLGLPLMGSSTIDSEDQVGLFKVYLALPNRYGFFNIQAKFYSLKAGDQWSVTGMALNPRLEAKSPEGLVINVDGVVPVPSPVVSTQS